MAKKLSEIQDYVDASTSNFIEYIKRNVDVEVYDFLLKLTEVTDVYIFSGVIRNFFLKREDVRDLDIVIRHDINIESLLNNAISLKRNSYGGYKINISEINIDLWTIEKTWAVQYQKRLELDIEVDNLHRFIPSTAFFNFSSILFSFNESKFYYKTEFLNFLQNREINYLYTPNANVSLCVVNSLYYAEKYNLKISDKLKRYLIQLYKTKLNYSETQIKHFGKILFTDTEINETISNFKFEKRQVSDYFMENLEEVFLKLGLNKDNGLFITNHDDWKAETSFPNRVKRLIENELKPDAFFCFDNKPLILFFENPLNKYELHKAIWNFNECPIAIIIQNNIVEIYNGFDFDLKSKLLDSIGKEEKLTDFNYFELVTGKTWEQYKELLDHKNRIDYHLLQNLKSARNILTNNSLNSKVANALIGKIIFVRYLIDRKVRMKFDGKSRTWTNEEFCELLDNPSTIREFFDYLDSEKGFNGGLFPLTDAEYDSISSSDYLVLKRLLLGLNIDTNQISLFQFYDFSIIPIEFISNIYEMFIGEDNQKKEGAYYTPLFLVDYILKETVEKHLNNRDRIESRINNVLSNSYSYCRVLDPACGSGIFLVETLRKIIEKFISETNIEIKSERFKTAIINLAKKNIYGIDKDSSAVQVAIFSIYLTLLDYLEPPSIENFKFPILYNSNFFEADFFDESASFNTSLKDIVFDYILGNPPWMRGKGEKEKPLYVSYIDNRRKKEKGLIGPKIDIGNKEIAQSFLLRTSDFSKEGKTRKALIVTSKVLYNLQSIEFRRYFLHHFLIEQIFELAPVRKEVFDKSNDKAIAPATVIFFNYANGKSTDSNIIEHIALKPSRFFSLFKIFTINRNDFKTIQQSRLREFDWLWKVLVYGSYLDFNFIQRLKNDYPTIKEIANTDNEFIIGQGLMVGGGDKNDATELVGKLYIDTRLDIKQYWINQNNQKTWQNDTVHRIRNKELYKAPVLLITEGVKNDLKAVSAVSYNDAIYKSSLTGIKGKNENSIIKLRQMSGIINSSFFSYFNLMTFSSSGIEREQSHDEEKLNVPFSLEKDIHTLVQEIEAKLTKKYNYDIIESFGIDYSIQEELCKIDNKIYELFSMTDEEKTLLNYANDIVIPTIMRHKSMLNMLLAPIKFKDVELENYAKTFLDRFQKNLETTERKFVVEIWHTNQIIGMFFKMCSVTEFSKSIVWIDKQNNDIEIIRFLATISSKKITDSLFVQKDIRGFEKDSFYLFKPNEKKLWHKAIGYLDVNDFAEAILKEGRKDYDV